MLNYFKQLFAETWANTEKSSIVSHSSFSNKFVNISVIVILCYIAFGLSVLKYYGNIDIIMLRVLDQNPDNLRNWVLGFFYGSDLGEFHKKIYWAGTIILVYLIIPVFIVKFGFKHRLRDYGVSFRNVHKDYPLYILMLGVMLPLVFYASSTLSFQERYPIFQPKQALLPLFFWWQCIYFLQFVAVEFFFRGFILHGLKKRFGFYAIFISMIPYCMVHFGKPFGETIAAIFAGIVLGTLSLKSRSIVLGILIHYSVAITMDLFALYREGYIFH